MRLDGAFEDLGWFELALQQLFSQSLVIIGKLQVTMRPFVRVNVDPDVSILLLGTAGAILQVFEVNKQ